MGLKVVNENKDLHVNSRGHTMDSDCVSSYPSDTQVANVSKDTTKRELLKVEGKEKELFKKQNINLFFGKVNSIEYCHEMFNFPNMLELEQMIKG